VLILVGLLVERLWRQGDDDPGKATAVGPIVKGPKGVALPRPESRRTSSSLRRAPHRSDNQEPPSGSATRLARKHRRHPRYELNYEIDPVQTRSRVQTAMKRVKNADKLLVSRSATRAGAMASSTPFAQQRRAGAVEVIGIPALGNECRSIDLSTLDKSTRLLIQIGTEDRSWTAPARGIAAAPAGSGLPGENIKINVVQGKIGSPPTCAFGLGRGEGGGSAARGSRARRLEWPVTASMRRCGSSPAAARHTIHAPKGSTPRPPTARRRPSTVGRSRCARGSTGTPGRRWGSKGLSRGAGGLRRL
jgi:hypothetical protein